MSELLKAERSRSALSSRELAFVLHRGRANVERLERLESLLASDPAFANTQEMNFLPRDKQYRRALRMSGRVEILARRHNLSEEDAEQLRLVFQGFTGCAASTTLHTLMFVKNLALLFTEAQQQRWMALAKRWRMVGCYAQTELGHGSNVRGLETTATYVPATDEFEIHSPSLTAIKWWPGALARTANFAVVYARLILADGRDYGVHNFMVQLRDLETHAPLPGVTMGDIGPKIGFNNVDNGYCRFTKVRIPREQMGMRVSKVTREGKYEKQAGVPQEVLYFTMLQTRMDFVRLAGLSLAKACTIAVRYSVVRQQGYDANDPKSSKELSVLDYQTQQYRLLPLLAASYAITLTGNGMNAFKRELSEQIHNGNTSMLSVGHAMSCGLKVLASDIAGSGMEACRRACGGHGYLLASGIPTLLGDMIQLVTAEGENFVLTVQTSRALMKVLAAFRKSGKVPDPLRFIAEIGSTQSRAASGTAARTKQQWLDPKVYVDAYQQRFLYLLSGLERKVAASSSVTAGIQNHSVHCYQLSMAYSKLVLVSSFAESVRSGASLSSENLETASTAVSVVRSLCHLFALTQLQQDAGEFMESGALAPADMPLIRENIEKLLLELRPHAVTLVDGFNFSDRTLNSALGRYDGNVYEALYESAQLERLNNGKVGVDAVSGDGAVALRELLIPIREEIERIEKERRSRL